MFFCEIAQELKKYMDPVESDGIFLIKLIDDVLRDPMTEKEEQMVADDRFNPISDLTLSMQNKIMNGSRFISKERAKLIYNRYDGIKLIEKIDDLYDENKENLQRFLANKGICVEINELGLTIKEILNQIFYGLSKGIKDVNIKLDEIKPNLSIRKLTGTRIYFENGKLVIDGENIELTTKLDESKIYDFEFPYISALCNTYAEALHKNLVTIDDIDKLPKKYKVNFYNQRKAYLSAESIQRSISEVYEDGENQFDILKNDMFSGIETTYYDEYDNGYRRLLEVLKKASDIQLLKSRLMVIKNLIGNFERLGIIHILVNDKTIKSWVDPYEE